MATVNFTLIPYSDPDIISPFRGGENWHDQFPRVDLPTEGAPGNPDSLDAYHRSWFTWAMLESSQGVYTLGRMDQEIRRCIDRRQRFSFSIMTLYPGDTTNVSPSAEGVQMSYPLYVHNLMQSEPTYRPWNALAIDWGGSTRWWVPNYNSTNYRNRFRALNQHIANWLETSTYNGVRYRDVIGYITIGGVGTWQEGHHHPFATNLSATPGSPGAWPNTGMVPLYNSLKDIVDMHLEVYPNYWLIAEMGLFDARGYQNTWLPPELASYIFSISNNKGKIGWRRDNWSSFDYSWGLSNNNRFSLNGVQGSELILNRWREAPVGGEPFGANTVEYSNVSNLLNEVNLYHASMVGNGNFGLGSLPDALKNNFRAAAKRMGYRLQITNATYDDIVSQGSPMSVSLTWRNVGIAPVYEDWVVTYEIRNKSNQLVYSSPSSHNLKLWYPGENVSQVVNDTIQIPTNIPTGLYDVNLIIKDPTGYRNPLPLAIRNRQADGSYRLFTDVTIVSSSTPTTTIRPTSTPSPTLTSTPTPTSTPISTSVGISTLFNNTNGNSETKNDNNAITLGVKFRTNVDGVIKKIRYWKTINDNSIKIGAIFNENGSILSEVSFNNETQSGWQEATFTSPINIRANTVYIAAYHSPSGNYTSTLNYFNNEINSGNLTALSVGNGLYVYSSGLLFPTNTYQSSNYWVDVVFDTVSVTNTPVPTSTPVPTATRTPLPTSTPVPTATRTPLPTSTPVPTATNTPVPTATSTPVPTGTPVNTEIMVTQTVFAGNNNLVLNNQPSTTVSLGNTNRYVTIMELDKFQTFKLVANVMVASVSANNPRIWVQYSKDNGTTWSNLSSTDNFISLRTVGVFDTPWIDIVDLAKGKVLVRVAQSGGNGTADPALGNVYIHYKQTLVDSNIEYGTNTDI
jgi:hypothetical protein